MDITVMQVKPFKMSVVHVQTPPPNHHLYCNKLSIDCLVQSENRKCENHHGSDSDHYYKRVA